MPYSIERQINDGIERISYYPETIRYQTPILFQHGAWHGAWCWQWWQELFAEWGWESHAISLPAHAGSAGNIRFCTLGLYRDTLMREMERLEHTPFVIGHSMGGAISQWMMKQRDSLPGVVLLASMPLRDNILRYVAADPLGMLLSTLVLQAGPLVRSPERAAALFISEGAVMAPQELQAKLNAESNFIVFQQMFWQPRKPQSVPVLVVAGEKDAIFSVEEERKLAEFYGGELHIIPNTAHNIMMEHSYQEAAQVIHEWLTKHELR